MTDEAFLCHACTGRLGSTLRSCVALIAELETTVARLGRHGETVGSRSAEKPLPVNLKASAHLVDLVNHLHGWARSLWEESGSEDQTRAPTEPVAEWLAANINSLRLKVWAPTIFTELDRLTESAWRLVDIPPDMMCLGNCDCGHPLRAAVGKSTVRCRNPECRKEHDAADRRWKMLDASEDMELPAGIISRALSTEDHPVTPSMIRNWAYWDAGHEGWFRPCRVAKDGKPLYRLGDAKRRMYQAKAAGIATTTPVAS